MINANLYSVYTCLSDLVLDDDQLKAYALAEIKMLLQSSGKSLSKYPPMPTADHSLALDAQDKFIQDEMNYNRPVLVDEHKKNDVNNDC